MSSVLRPDGDEVSFAYDALGRRVTKTFRGRTTRWVWDGDSPLHEWVEETFTPGVGVSVPDASDAIAAQREAVLSALVRRGPPQQGSRHEPITWVFEPGTFTPIARTVAGLVQTGVSDHLGVVIGIFDADGRPIWQGQSDIWGDHRSPEGVVSPWQFRWPGQYFDSETGLSYNRHHYYDPDTGTYCSTDPLGLAGGLHPYAYVADVLTHIDPHGLMGNNACGKAAKGASKLADASSAAFKAADGASGWAPKAKHLAGAGGRWQKFAVGADPGALVEEALRSPGTTFRTDKTAGRFIVETDLGRSIGTKGETWLKVVVSDGGDIITGYPVKR